MKISKQKTGYPEVVIDYYLGEDIQDPQERLEWAIKEFGAGVVVSMWHQSALRDVRAKISNLLTDPDAVDQEAIQASLDGWKFGQGGPRSTGMRQSVKQYLAKKREELGDEEFINFLKSQISGGESEVE